MHTFIATTEGITVTVHPLYFERESDPIARKFVFAYFIRIENHTSSPVILLRRHWIITYSNGRLEEVEGEGVIGKQPTIAPGGFHEYNSFSILDTLQGEMEGTYLMQRQDGEQFRVTIPKFFLRGLTN